MNDTVDGDEIALTFQAVVFVDIGHRRELRILDDDEQILTQGRHEFGTESAYFQAGQVNWHCHQVLWIKR